MPVSEQRRTATAATLRAKAEEKLSREGEEFSGLSRDKMQSVIHELHVHQIELEMQNEQLRLNQEQLEEARERFAELYDFAPIGYVTLSRAGVIKEANLTSVTMLGLERGALLRQPFNRFVFPADQDSLYHCLRKVFESEGTQSCELRLTSSGGELFFARVEAVRVREGKADVCLMTMSDITEQKRAEEALRASERRRLKYESEEWKRLAVEAGDLGALDQDLKTGRISCSAQASAMLGYAADASFTWESLMARIHPEDRNALLREVEKSNDPNGTRRCEAVFRVRPRDGEERWLRFAARTFFDGAPARPTRRTGVLADITRLKQAEEMLKSRAERLDTLVGERTARLQEAVGELEHLSYTLVHDLRAPLRAIAGYTNLMLDQSGALSATHKKFLERSHAAALRMDNLILDALSYSQVVRERFTLARVDCAALLGQIIESYPEFQEASDNISVEGSFPDVLGNPALLTQCFSNLLTNALKFMPPRKTPFVRIFAHDKKMRVRIWVEDNGIGISEEGRKKIFGMFQRLNQEYEGTGIGLALVKKAVERMGGSLGVESELGKGSRFWIELDKAPAGY